MLDVSWSIDAKADPCEDFSAHVCGGFNPKIPVHESRANRLDLIRERNMLVIKSILEGAASHPISHHEAANRRNLRKLQDLYSSCMNDTQIARVGRQPVLDVIQEIVTLFPVNKGNPFEHLQKSTMAETLERTMRNNISGIDSQAFSRTLAFFNKIGLDSLASFKERRNSLVPGETTFELHSDPQGQFSDLEYLTDREELYSGAEKDAIANVAKTLHLLMTPKEDSVSLNATDTQEVPQKWKHVALDALRFASRLDKIHPKPKISPVQPWVM
ncbi:Endothelin-converting enzyme 2 [Mortierella alpina]|nr:Endothelin-converting enzyme 2 [Mortierella alpina]